MEGVLRRVSPVLYLTRVTTAFAAVGNLWFIILWSRGNPAEHTPAPPVLVEAPLWLLLGAATAVAVGLFSYATAMNDAFDARRDRALHPDRPIPAGALSLEAAAAIVAFALILGVLGATFLGVGAVLIVLLTASAILFYNLIGRYVPSVGLVLLGLIYAAHMVAGNVSIRFVWPIWLVMTHALLLGAVVYRAKGKRPALTVRSFLIATMGWAFWSFILLWVGYRRTGGIWPEWVHWRAAIAPIILAGLFVLFAWSRLRRARDRTRAADRIQRYGALVLPVYDTAWLFGAGLNTEGFVLLALAAVGFLGMTILREVYGLIEHPVGFRRA
ncbi:MAG TPA: UbiA family prenyltransferase [Phycisphaerales bacterium]|nr:UbiA family prenyltransferase [Phycisphaerales bacterium]